MFLLYFVAFSSDETVKMIKQIKSQIPNDDTNRYNNRFEKIKWEQVKGFFFCFN